MRPRYGMPRARTVRCGRDHSAGTEWSQDLVRIEASAGRERHVLLRGITVQALSRTSPRGAPWPCRRWACPLRSTTYAGVAFV